MASDVPPLHEQEEQGQFFEAVEKIVDGLVEDIKAGHVTSYKEAVVSYFRTAELSEYARDASLALVAVKYAKSRMYERRLLKMAEQILKEFVREELGRREEFRNLPTK